jgi:hypothetical protein
LVDQKARSLEKDLAHEVGIDVMSDAVEETLVEAGPPDGFNRLATQSRIYMA